MKLVNFCVVDAFAISAFKGNPAAVCLLEEDRNEEWMQNVAMEFNQPITCFLKQLPGDDKKPVFSIRWFTPILEVKLCGHATMSASHFLFTRKFSDFDVIEYISLFSGILVAKKVDHTTKTSSKEFTIELNFPATLISEYNGPIDATSFAKSLSYTSSIIKILVSPVDIILVLPSGEDVAKVIPDLNEISKYPGRGIIVSGIAPPNSGFDIISRFFSPSEGINEDQVCGSAHCALAPYWCKELGKRDLIAYQASQRGGVLNLHVDENDQRVFIRGGGVLVMEGNLLV